MLPLSLLRTSVGHPMLVELKNGETYNGHLVNCDTWMNLHLREVICTSKDGDRFWRMAECYVRGNTVKYLRVPPEVPLPWLSRPPHPYPGCICIPPARLRGSQQTHETLDVERIPVPARSGVFNPVALLECGMLRACVIVSALSL
jgi:small nuclear ribonucleoprotein (snRNP)-like protein